MLKVNKKRFGVTRLTRSGVRRGMALAGKGDFARGGLARLGNLCSVCANTKVWRHRPEL